MNKTKIPWADFTWNPITGCTPVSEGCQNCYAERMARRFHKYETPDSDDGYIPEPGEKEINPDYFKVVLHPKKLDEPLRRKKPARIFVCSMSDLFHENVPNKFILDVFGTMNNCPQHTFLVLTKRPDRMNKLLAWLYNYPLPNVWLGVTAENQARADERIPLLLQTPAAKRFVSIEPMLGPINLNSLSDGKTFWTRPAECEQNAIDWVIAGGETGPGARECKEEWIQSVYNQCQVAGVPFFFKQPGKKWIPADDSDYSPSPLNIWSWEKRREFPK
jgi:protein gp37